MYVAVMCIWHFIILKRLHTLSLNPHGNLDVGEENTAQYTDEDTEAQRGHMFMSELMLNTSCSKAQSSH